MFNEIGQSNKLVIYDVIPWKFLLWLHTFFIFIEFLHLLKMKISYKKENLFFIQGLHKQLCSLIEKVCFIHFWISRNQFYIHSFPGKPCANIFHGIMFFFIKKKWIIQFLDLEVK